ncbi:MAG: serine/threonine protein kinase [Sandaracinaceae bacterium]|nr:serine/threonine protein kinase [Sandaracinaceae bacterium]
MADLSSTDARNSLTLGPVLPYSLGRFTLCEELGAGGMATVYLAKMRLAAGLERHVAIKTIHAHLAKQQAFVDMFLDEAKIASHISHPNVCAVYDFGDVQGLYYIAMEYLVGAPLIEVVNAVVEAGDDELLDTLPYLSARIIADAAEGLHAAHTLRGSDGNPLHVIHRDVSPQNLFVTHEGSVKVVDFGCAKALERVTQTNTGVLKGKVAYAAPEQLRGEAVDARVDVFALGVCLWECLTLRNLFRRDNAILTAQAVLNDPIPPADEGNDWVPRPLAAIAAKALERDPEKRFASAREMGRALRGFIAGSGVMFESAEVADTMEKLFAQRHADTLRRLDALGKVEVSQVGPVATPEPAAVEVVPAAAPETVPPPARKKKKKGQKALETAPTKLEKTPAKAENAWEISKAGLAEEDPVVLPTRTGRYVTLTLLLLALIGGGVYAYMFHRAPIFAALGIATEPATDTDTDPVIASPDPEVVPEVEPPPVEDPELATPEDTPPETVEDTPPEDTPPALANDDSLEPAPTATNNATNNSQTNNGTEVESTSSRRRRRQADDEATTTVAAGTPTTTQRTDEAIVQPSRTIDFSQGVVMVRAAAGWAYVEHAGRRLGRTPLRAELPSGAQTLRIIPFGRANQAFTRNVTVAWGSPQTLTLELPGTEGWDNPY